MGQSRAGKFYIVAVAGFLVFVLFLMFSRYGGVKLGPDESEPEYSYLSWFAMLFGAGMGIGLLNVCACFRHSRRLTQARGSRCTASCCS